MMAKETMVTPLAIVEKGARYFNFLILLMRSRGSSKHSITRRTSVSSSKYRFKIDVMFVATNTTYTQQVPS